MIYIINNYNCYIFLLKSSLILNSQNCGNGGVKTTVIVMKSSFYRETTDGIVACKTIYNIDFKIRNNN